MASVKESLTEATAFEFKQTPEPSGFLASILPFSSRYGCIMPLKTQPEFVKVSIWNQPIRSVFRSRCRSPKAATAILRAFSPGSVWKGFHGAIKCPLFDDDRSFSAWPEGIEHGHSV